MTKTLMLAGGLAAFCLAAPSAFAAAENHNSSRSNVALSTPGDPVPGIDISLEQIPGGVTASGKLFEDGQIAFVNLSPGDYKLMLGQVPAALLASLNNPKSLIMTFEGDVTVGKWAEPARVAKRGPMTSGRAGCTPMMIGILKEAGSGMASGRMAAVRSPVAYVQAEAAAAGATCVKITVPAGVTGFDVGLGASDIALEEEGLNLTVGPNGVDVAIKEEGVK